MTTTEHPRESSTKPRYLTHEYEVVRDDRTYRCRKFEYFGVVYESGYEVGGTTDVLLDLFPEPIIGPGDPGYDDLIGYLNSFLIEPEDQDPE